MEMLALCALAPVEPEMSKAGHYGQYLTSEYLSSDNFLRQRCMDRQWQIADKDTKYLSKKMEMEMSTPDNMDKVCDTRLRALQTVTLTFSFPSWSLCTCRY